jgi:hypothetical protein
MFCVCVVIALILVLFALYCAPSRAFIFVLLLLAFVVRVCACHLRAGSLPAFEHLWTRLLRIDAPITCGLSFIH